MSTCTVEVYARSAAPPEAVWRWLADAPTWSSWSRLTRAELEQEGEPAPNGVGAIRRFGIGRNVSREQVVAFEPPHHLGYVLLSGMPVLGYRADVRLAADGDGTLIEWRSSFTPRFPGTGRLIQLFFTKVLRDFARAVARRAATASPA
jgi:hypothetical protein